MKVYIITVTQEREQDWSAACRAQVIGAGHLFSDGIGSGPDPAEAAHDAMVAAELGLPVQIRDVPVTP